MKLHELILARNRHLTIFEKNKCKKLFDDKAKRMPKSLSDELSDVEILETEGRIGVTVVVLDIGKTVEQLEEDKRKVHLAAKNAMRRIGLATTLLMSSSLGGNYGQE